MVAANPPPSFARRDLQQILVREGPAAFTAFLCDWGIRLVPDDLSELAWFLMPGPQGEEHIFLTRVPDAAEVSWAALGGQELGSLVWMTPSRVLQLYSRGDLELTLMQWYVLHELSRSLPKLHALPDLLAAPPSKAAPLWFPTPVKLCKASGADREEMHLLLPGDADHPSSPGVSGQRHRLMTELVGSELRVRGLELSAGANSRL
mmetsp:Transcript_18628/g.51428  ORF Transcript_18628/g.51428 Transcript_18628/m.51428 type:complete len:205 (+) Transcript_18628:1-615(+)